MAYGLNIHFTNGQRHAGDSTFIAFWVRWLPRGAVIMYNSSLLFALLQVFGIFKILDVIEKHQKNMMLCDI